MAKPDLPKGLDTDEVVGSFKGTKGPEAPKDFTSEAQHEAMNANVPGTQALERGVRAGNEDPLAGFDLFEKPEVKRKEPTTALELAQKRLANRPPEQRFNSLVEDLTRQTNSFEFDEDNTKAKEGTGTMELDALRTNLLSNFPNLGNYVGQNGETLVGAKVEKGSIVVTYKVDGQKKLGKVTLSADGSLKQ